MRGPPESACTNVMWFDLDNVGFIPHRPENPPYWDIAQQALLSFLIQVTERPKTPFHNQSFKT